MSENNQIRNISLSYSCDKNFNDMMPCGTGRHCAACDKLVIDFTNKDLSALTKAMENNTSICGRFTRSQLAFVPAKTSRFRSIAAKLVLALGLGFLNKEMTAQVKTSDSSITSKTDEQEVLLGVVDMMPVYKNGGNQGMNKFIMENIKVTPNDSLYGKVYVQFTIDSTGKVIDPKILRGLTKEANEEVLRVVQLLEFIPGNRFGKNVNTSYNLPIQFKSK